MDRSVIIALVIFVFLWIVILKYCIETNDWTGFIYLNGLALLVTICRLHSKKGLNNSYIIQIYSQSNYSMKCKSSSYVVKHSLTTLKYNNIS